ncbi:hypothetical protein RSOL_287920 [Rhizoctonia solani AG-3 Rhs1AP]|uniref:Jacalin-type lectin domain-containing protein n=1 Tax=Rhizoctonia solani AG-3 Rhs1AP TaxID=1086054 RepID=A0A0A1UL30_9AGAM|nr:hypothetical protein RSOL_287920 [Rhizoctonia solani AG-3 Rhs1AP]
MKYTIMLQLVSFLAAGTLSMAYVANIPPASMPGSNPPPPAPGGVPPVGNKYIAPGSSQTYGAPGTSVFNDGANDAIAGNANLTSLILRGKSRLDAITFNLNSQQFRHGGWGGKDSILNLAFGDCLTKMEVCWDVKDSMRIFYAHAKTAAGHEVSAGIKTSNCATVPVPEGHGIVAGLGKAKEEIDQLGFIFRPCIPLYVAQ